MKALIARRGRPGAIVSDNGTEFTSPAVLAFPQAARLDWRHIAALSRQVLEDLDGEYAEQFRSLSLTRRQTAATLILDARYSLLTVGLAGFGRAIAEVGAVIIVGGNIDHLTRVMTTAIALETSKGDLALAMALGLVVMTLALAVNAVVHSVRFTAVRYAYA